MDKLPINLRMRGEGLRQDHKASKESQDLRDHKVWRGRQDLQELWGQPVRKALRDQLDLLAQQEQSVPLARRGLKE